MHIYLNYYIKKFYFFSSQSIKMNGKNINFNDKIIKKSDFYNNKNKIIFNIDDIDVNKILVSKKEQYGNIIHLNTLVGVMIMMLLDHYTQGFHT